MRQNYLFKTFFLLCALLVGGISSAWAQEADVTYDFTGNDWSVSEGVLTDGNTTFTGEGSDNFKKNSGYFMMGKNGAYINFPVYDKNVEKIVVTGNSGASASTKMNIYVGDEAASTETVGSKGVNTYEIDEAYQTAGTQYTLKVTSAHNAQITKIEVYFNDSDPSDQSEATTVKIDATGITNTNVSEGTAAGQLTAAVTDAAGAPVEGAAITWTSDNEQVATIAADGTVALVAAGTVTFTASYAGVQGQYKASRATYEMTVTAASEPVETGDMVEYDFTNGSWTVSDGVLSDESTTFKGYGKDNFKMNTGYFMMGKSGAYINFPVYDKNVEKIVVTGNSGASASTKMNIYVGDEAVSTETVGSTGVNTYEIDEAFQTAGTQYTLKVTSAHNAQITKIEVYFKDSDPSDQSVATTVTIDDTGIINTNVFDGTAAGKLIAAVTTGDGAPVEGAAITWASDNEQVATIAADGTVTLVTAGTVTFTASYAGLQGQYKASRAAYEMTVTNTDPNAPGLTKENPYTVAQAITNTPSDGEVYIKGIVSAFYKEGGITADGSNYRYYISDNGTTDNQLLVYQGKGLNNEAFANDDDLLVGDEVIIYGQLITYKNAPEINSGNYIVSLTRKADERAETTMSIGSHEDTGVAGETLTLPAAVVLATAEVEGLNITWTSSDETVATIDVENKKINLLAAGETTITATFDGNEEYKACKASYVLTVTAAPVEVNNELYSLVTDASGLAEDDKVLVVNKEEGMAMSTTQNNNNRGQAAVTITEEDQIKGITPDVQVIVLKGNDTDGWYLTVDGGYLYAASNSSNHLKTEAEKDENDNAKAAIELDEEYNAIITFKGKNARNTLRYNSSSDIFSCYDAENSQKPVQLFKYSGTTAIQTVARTADTDGVAYNLAGQRVENPTKGLFIINGKKVILK